MTNGIETAVKHVLGRSALPAEKIASVTIGTTHFINAVVEQDARRLRRVAIIRLSKSFLRGEYFRMPATGETTADLYFALLRGATVFRISSRLDEHSERLCRLWYVVHLLSKGVSDANLSFILSLSH